MVKKHSESNNSKFSDTSSGAILLVLVVLAVIIIAGAIVIFKPFGERIDYSMYNGFSFDRINENIWQTTVEMNSQLYEVPFYNHPRDLEDFSYDDNVSLYVHDVINTIKPKRTFLLAIHPDSGSTSVLAGINIARITGKFYGVETHSALYLEEDEREQYSDFNAPLVTCEDATFKTPIIWVNVNSSRTGIFMSEDNDHCMLVEASNSDDILKAGDIFGYKLLGIMK